MTERNQCLIELKEVMIGKLIDQRENNRERYLETIKNLIKQSMIKLLEPALTIVCREDDKDDIEGMLEDIQ